MGWKSTYWPQLPMIPNKTVKGELWDAGARVRRVYIYRGKPSKMKRLVNED